MKMTTLTIMLAIGAIPLIAAEFTIQTVDGVGRLLAGVQIHVSCGSKSKNSLQLTSDASGQIHGTYDPARCEPLSVSIAKEGYQPYSTGFRQRYVLQRNMDAQELHRIATLPIDERRSGLREMLGGSFTGLNNDFGSIIFYYEAEFRPLLRELLHDPALTQRVRHLLASIAAPEDLHELVRLSSLPSAVFEDRWRYAVATSLVNPDSEDEWEFLRKCAADVFKDGWVDAGAIQTLKITGSDRSRQILEEALSANPRRNRSITAALGSITSNPIHTSGGDLEALAKSVAQAIKIGDWEGNGAPRFNHAGDKAMVDFRFQTSEDAYVYTAIFHRVSDAWVLRGVGETMQAFAPKAVTIKTKKQ